MRLKAGAVLAAAVVVAVAVGAARAQARPPRCPRLSTPDDCKPYHNSSNDRLQYEFSVQKNYFKIEYTDGSQMKVSCEKEGGPRLDSGLLPAFETELVVGRVVIHRCGVTEYAALFRTLNVTLTKYFHLTLDYTGSTGALTAAHLARLPGTLRSLTLNVAGSPRGPLLANLTDLTALVVIETTLPPGELEPPPPLLESVKLMGAGVSRVPAALLALPGLRQLTVTGKDVVEVERPAPGTPCPLPSLVVSAADGALLARWAPPSLVKAYLSGWRNPGPPEIPSCESLAALTLVSPAARELPPGWVSRCPRLSRLEVTSAKHLTSLPERLLSEASSLTRFVFRSGSLAHLPARLFDETPRLIHVDLSGNRLKELPSGALGPVVGTLLELNLSDNELTSEVAFALASLRHLRKLSLANNTDMQDLCNTDKHTYTTLTKNTSPLSNLSQLKILNLKNTKVTSICSDWRSSLVLLAELDLRGTRISSLVYEDLVYTRHVDSVVCLEDVPLHEVIFTAEDYRAAAAAPAANVTVVVELGGSGTRLVCDCYLYWFARALEDGLLPGTGPVDGEELRCADGGTLLADELLCVAGEGACPPLPRGCTCGARSDVALGGDGTVLRVRCEGAGLQRVPRLPPLDAGVLAVDLLLAGNAITDLTADDVPPILRTLDLRNNSIEAINEATALALVGNVGERARHVRLAGNPLDCTTCTLAGARRVLRAGRRYLDGYETAVRCSGAGPAGRLLADVPDEECEGGAAALAASLAGLAAAAALALAAVAARRGALRRLKALLWRLGLAPAPGHRLSREQMALPYDVFVTFGGGDESAALEVTARLEGGARPRRVLLQERDWLPPAWVPHCIEVSVSVARRTLALVSPPWERWLESGEVRAAYEPALRGALLLVLPPADDGGGGEPADSALRRYARDYPHLVLRRGEPDFWRRLERALPPPAPSPV